MNYLLSTCAIGIGTINNENLNLVRERGDRRGVTKASRVIYAFFMNSTLLLGSRRIAAGLLSALSGRSAGRKKETRKMSVIPRLIKTAIFHDSLEF